MVTRQLQVERRTGKVRRPKTDVLPHVTCEIRLLPNAVAWRRTLDVFGGICLFVGGWVVCQHDNFRTSKHRMMKLGGRCIVYKPAGAVTAAGSDSVAPTLTVRLRRWENQRRLFSFEIILKLF